MKRFQTKTYQIPTEKIKARPVRLAFLSDLHSLSFGKDNSALLQAVADAAPDLVLVGGDMMVGEPSPSFDVAERLLSALVKNFPVYHAFGNHEHRLMADPERYGDGFRGYRERLRGRGVEFLQNGHARVETEDGTSLVIWGWDGEARFYKKIRPAALKTEDLEWALGTLWPGAYHILLAHSPQFGKTYFSWGADLILSGHYHGGVCRFSENRGLIAPNFRLFPAYCCGSFTRGAQHMVVSPGLGEHTVPLRIHDPRELIVIELVHGGDV